MRIHIVKPEPKLGINNWLQIHASTLEIIQTVFFNDNVKIVDYHHTDTSIRMANENHLDLVIFLNPSMPIRISSGQTSAYAYASKFVSIVTTGQNIHSTGYSGYGVVNPYTIISTSFYKNFTSIPKLPKKNQIAVNYEMANTKTLRGIRELSRKYTILNMAKCRSQDEYYTSISESIAFIDPTYNIAVQRECAHFDTVSIIPALERTYNLNINPVKDTEVERDGLEYFADIVEYMIESKDYIIEALNTLSPCTDPKVLASTLGYRRNYLIK